MKINLSSNLNISENSILDKQETSFFNEQVPFTDQNSDLTQQYEDKSYINTFSDTKASTVETISNIPLPFASKISYIEMAIKDIQQCDFVALDLEFAGLFVETPPRNSIENYFKACVEGASTYLSLQLGICTAKQNNNVPQNWTLSPYNFYIYPSHRQLFSIDTKCLRWLYSNGFSFNEWISEGIDYTRLSELQQNKETPKTKQNYENEMSEFNVEKYGLQRIIEAIIENEKPIVVHNGHLDIMHLYDKFIGQIPPEINEFCKDWMRLFTGGLFDTRYIANEGRYSMIGIIYNRGLSLSQLRQHLFKKHHSSVFNMAEHRNDCTYKVNKKADEDDDVFHEAGFDAMATAQTFVLELELFTHSSKNSLSQRKRKRLKLEPPPIMPSPWLDNTNFQKLKNYVAIPHISPGSLYLAAFS